MFMRVNRQCAHRARPPARRRDAPVSQLFSSGPEGTAVSKPLATFRADQGRPGEWAGVVAGRGASRLRVQAHGDRVGPSAGPEALMLAFGRFLGGTGHATLAVVRPLGLGAGAVVR
jgi:hypothetical protein